MEWRRVECINCWINRSIEQMRLGYGRLRQLTRVGRAAIHWRVRCAQGRNVHGQSAQCLGRGHQSMPCVQGLGLVAGQTGRPWGERLPSR